MTQPDRDPFRQTKNFKETVASRVVIVGAVAGLAISLVHNALSDTKDPGNDRLQAKKNEYHAKQLSKQGRLDLEYLAELQPQDIFGLNGTQSRVRLVMREGQYLQNAAVQIAGELRMLGAAGKTDEYSVVQDLLQSQTKEALKEAGIEFTKVDPVHCDVVGEPYQNPRDYSNHVSGDFAVHPTRPPQELGIRVPLGTAQTALDPDIYQYWLSVRGDSDLLHSASLSKVSCTDKATYGQVSEFSKEVYTTAPAQYPGWD